MTDLSILSAKMTELTGAAYVVGKRHRKPIRERTNTKMSLSLAPLSVEEALDALLSTPPPPGETKSPYTMPKKRKRR